MKRKRIAKTIADIKWAIQSWGRRVEQLEDKLKGTDYQAETMRIRLEDQARRTYLPENTVEYAHQKFDQFNTRIENILKRLHTLEHGEASDLTKQGHRLDAATSRIETAFAWLRELTARQDKTDTQIADHELKIAELDDLAEQLVNRVNALEGRTLIR